MCEILIAIGFFALGFLIGGTVILKAVKKAREKSKDIEFIIYDTYVD